MAHIYNGILVTLKRGKILTYASTWRNLEDITVSEVNLSQNDKYCVIPLIYEVVGVVKIIETESRIVVALSGGG